MAHYRITAAIGAGGMGEVYRATDTKLGRQVALKVLPDEVARDPERLGRFRREAQLLASLNHPNVATIHGLDDAGGMPFLVLELVEGEDLAARLRRGGLPLEEALPIAAQIAEGLEEAHEKGIVHRDLKPANVKLTPDGKIKILDFGIAKALLEKTGESSGAASSSDLSQSPTLAHAGTAAGLILGTAAYMSPEQARGRKVDRRSDIWAFGVLLYEMLSGRRLFEGDSVTDVLAAVIRQEIDYRALPAATPGSVRRLLTRCLDRDPRTRLRDIGEARVALGAPEQPDPAAVGSGAPVGRALRPGFWLAVAAACLLAGFGGGALFVKSGGSTKAPERAVRTLVLPSPGRTLDDSQAISPDGMWIAYTAGDSLWIRNLGELESREVPGSNGASRPFWSPRSDAVAFAAGNALFKVSRDGGRPVELCRISRADFTGGSWSASKGIVFTSSSGNWDGEVMRVPEEGGQPEPFARADNAKGERRLYDPHFLPDGRSLLYTVTTQRSNDGEIAIDRDGTRTLLGTDNGASQPAWSPTGHVVFTRSAGSDRALWALPCSVETMAPRGEAFRIAVGGTVASVSAGGTLVYGRRQPAPLQLTWVDRTGRVLSAIGGPIQSTLVDPSISPDGWRVSMAAADQSISVLDADRGVETRVTGEGEVAYFPEWLPGSDAIVYSHMGGTEGLWTRRADGSGEARSLLPRASAAYPSVSRDGRYIAFYVVDPETARDLWAFEVDRAAEPFVVQRTKANEAHPRISPDGKFVAYQSDASGRWEVMVQPFPGGEGRWQISGAGGQHARWSPRGGELFYVSGDDLMAVEVTTQPGFKAGTPRRLFSGKDVGTRLSMRGKLERFYDVAPDGGRFVVVQGVQMGSSDVVLAEGAFSRGAGEKSASEKSE